MINFINAFHKHYARISYFLATLITIFLTCLGFAQLIYRYIVGRTLIWAPDVTIFCITTTAALTIPPLWLDNDHISMDLISEKLSPKADFLLNCFTEVVCMVMAVVVAYGGYIAVVSHIGYVTSILRYDDAWKYVFVIYLGVMLFICIAMSLIRRILIFRQGGQTNGN